MEQQEPIYHETIDELQGLIQQRLSTIESGAADDEILRTRLDISTLSEIGHRASEAARVLGVAAVRDSAFSRVQLSKLLGVHQATAARWVLDADARKDAGPDI